MMLTRRITKLFLGNAACVALPITAPAQQMESHIGKVTGHSDAGKQLFYRYCWGCHGFRGDGNGENWLPPTSWFGPYLNIQPRGFFAPTLNSPPTPTPPLPTTPNLHQPLVR